jgi:hypothetical protein
MAQGSWHLQKRKEANPLRVVLVPVLMLVVFYYLSVLAQQAGKLLVAHLAGSQLISLQVGQGQPRSTSEYGGYKVQFCTDWWWGPQVLARMEPSVTATKVVNLAAPLTTLLILIAVLIDLRRARTQFSYIVIAANVLALLSAYAVMRIYH